MRRRWSAHLRTAACGIKSWPDGLVIPAKAGIQGYTLNVDSRFRGNDKGDDATASSYHLSSNKALGIFSLNVVPVVS